MPTFRHGKLTKVFLDQYDLSNQLRQADVNSDADTAETSAFGTFDKTFVVGLLNSTLAISGMFSGSAGEIDAVLGTILADDIDHVLTVCQEGTGLAGTGIGRHASLMPGKLTSKVITASLADMVGISGSVQGDGATRQGVLLHDFATLETTTGNSTSVDNAAASAAGGAGHLHVVTNTRNGTLIAKVQHSTDNITFPDLLTFATIGSTTVGSERQVVAGTVNRYVRGQWTIAGSSGSIAFLIAFARYPF